MSWAHLGQEKALWLAFLNQALRGTRPERGERGGRMGSRQHGQRRWDREDALAEGPHLPQGGRK